MPFWQQNVGSTLDFDMDPPISRLTSAWWFLSNIYPSVEKFSIMYFFIKKNVEGVGNNGNSNMPLHDSVTFTPILYGRLFPPPPPLWVFIIWHLYCWYPNTGPSKMLNVLYENDLFNQHVLYLLLGILSSSCQSMAV